MLFVIFFKNCSYPQVLSQLIPTEPQWQNEVRWVRTKLVELKMLDPMSCPYGVWIIVLDKIAVKKDRDLTIEEKVLATKKGNITSKVSHTPDVVSYNIGCKNGHLAGYAEVPVGQKPHSIAVRCSECADIASILVADEPDKVKAN
jgi:hypothetical protein